MKRTAPLACLAFTGCLLGELLNPSPPPPAEKCYVALWQVRRDPVTGVPVDSAWLGTTEVACTPVKP